MSAAAHEDFFEGNTAVDQEFIIKLNVTHSVLTDLTL